MKGRLLLLGLVLGALALPGASVWALGTAAGTVITNTARASYEIGGVAATPVVGSVSVTIDEVIDVTVVSQDAGNVPVTSPGTGGVLTFLITNTGNGIESFQLVSNDNPAAADQFNPAVTAIFIESNGVPGLQTAPSGGLAADVQYDGTAATHPELDANGAVLATVVYVVADTPAGHSAGDTGVVELSARSLTAGAPGSAAGTGLAFLGDGGVDAIVGTTNADGADAGVFQIEMVAVTLNKTVFGITDPFGGADEVPGATVTYRIDVEVSGNGTAGNLTITDAIPANTTFVPGSIALDGVLQSDTQDLDATDFGVSAPNTATVALGNVRAPQISTIQLQVIID